MSFSDAQLAREALFEVIRNQIRDQDPPETKQTYERLIAEGHSHEETMKLISCVLISELSDTLQQQPFNPVRYAAALDALPELPWDED